MRLRVAEDKVAEAHVLLHDVAQVNAHGLGVLVDEVEVLRLGLRLVLCFAALEYQRYVLVVLAYGAQQLEAGLGVLYAVLGVAAVRDDAERMVRVALVKLHGLLVVTRQHHLGPAPHAECGAVGVERLGREALALGEDVSVKHGQQRRVEAYAVLHKENHLHAGLGNVVLDVHLILDKLYYRHYEVGVAEPAEHVVEYREVFVLHAARNAVREGRQHDAWYRGELGLDVARHREGVVVRRTGHADYEVYARGGKHVLGLLRGADLPERGRVAHAQLGVFVEDFLVYASVVFKHEGVVRVGHDKNIEDTVGHEVHERHVLQIEFTPLLWDVFTHIS